MKCETCENEAKYSFDGIVWFCNKCMIQGLVESDPLIEISDVLIKYNGICMNCRSCDQINGKCVLEDIHVTQYEGCDGFRPR